MSVLHVAARLFGRLFHTTIQLALVFLYAIISSGEWTRRLGKEKHNGLWQVIYLPV